MESPGRNHRWVWYFLILAALALAAAGGLIAYNLHQQLTPEALAAEKTKWREKGPRDYRLVYVKSGSISGEFEVEVHGGKAIKVVEIHRGQASKVVEERRELEPRLHPYYGMDALFADLERFLEMKSEPGGKRRFLKASFDRDDGHLLQFVLSDPSLEVTVLEFEPLPPKKPLSSSP